MHFCTLPWRLQCLEVDNNSPKFPLQAQPLPMSMGVSWAAGTRLPAAAQLVKGRACTQTRRENAIQFQL